jgi:threonine/homoserine/homoserine lactone efflux protein
MAATLPEPLLATTIRWQAIGSLMLAAAAVMGSPGPATISVAAVASAYGVRRSLPSLAGAILGTTLVLAAVATGVTATLSAVPALQTVVIVFSAAYILWLAYRIATAPTLVASETSVAAPSLVSATLLAVANPKAWVAIAAIFVSARVADTATADAVAKTAVLSVMIVLIMVAWLLAGASLASVLRNESAPESSTSRSQSRSCSRLF